MINYILSEKLQKTIASNNISKSDEISIFIDEILQAGNSNYKLDHSEYIDWIKSPEFMLNQIEGINHFVTKTKNYKRFIFIGMGASTIIPNLMSSNSNFIFLDGSEPNIKETLIKDYEKSLVFIISKTGKTLETKTMMNQYIQLISDLKKGYKYQENMVAITDHGSELYEFAIENNFMEVFSNLKNTSGRFSPISFSGLIPAAISGVDIKNLIENIIKFKKDLKHNKDTRKKIIILIDTIHKVLTENINIFRLISKNKNDPKIIWVQQMISESLAKNKNFIIPILGEYNNSSKFTDNLDIIFDNKMSQIKALENTNNIVFEDVSPSSKYYGSFVYSIMIIISALSYIENKNPYTQPNVEKTKNYLTDTKLPLCISDEINISNIKYASFMFFTKNKNLLNENINQIKAFMNSINIPIFIDIAPGYLHTTGELHKNKSDAIHFIVHEKFSKKTNELNLDDILVKQINAEIKILSENKTKFVYVNSNKLIQITKDIFKGKL
tara:strand:+ start:1270 stop:2763 length:1494 start_codon:yes stop_codon:yes gene_type:complete